MDFSLAQLSNGALDTAQAGEAAKKSLDSFVGAVMPWLGGAAGQDTMMRLQALWYMNYAPEKLQQAIVRADKAQGG